MEPTVLVTGFGPFGGVTVNPSWQVMKSFDGAELRGHRLVAHELPVVYESVSKMVPELWQRYPGLQLCVHCGVGLTGGLRLEQRARNATYSRLDNNGKAPPEGRCIVSEPDYLQYSCAIDLAKVINELKASDPTAQLDMSSDAGLYLCEFTYYASLHLNKAPTVFLHVPPLEQPYSLEALQALCRRVLESVIDQLPMRPSPKVGVAVLLRNLALHPGCVVVGRRLAKHADGNAHGLGTYAAPGGHLQLGESFEDCARREIMEECGLQLQAVQYGTTLNMVEKPGYHYVVVVMVGDVEKEPETREPHKCGGWLWAPWEQLLSPLFRPLFSSLAECKRIGFCPF